MVPEGAAGRMLTVPKPHPKEFRDDVVAVARKGEASIAEIAKDFGISESCLRNWLAKADVEDDPAARRDRRRVGRAAGAETPEPAAGAGERGAAPGRGLSVAGEPAGKMMYPLVRELAADGIPVTVTCRVLQLARQPYYRWLAAPVGARELDQAYLANARLRRPRRRPGVRLPAVG